MVLERGKDYAPKGVDKRIEANIVAIELSNKIAERRPFSHLDRKNFAPSHTTNSCCVP